MTELQSAQGRKQGDVIPFLKLTLSLVTTEYIGTVPSGTMYKLRLIMVGITEAGELQFSPLSKITPYPGYEQQNDLAPLTGSDVSDGPSLTTSSRLKVADSKRLSAVDQGCFLTGVSDVSLEPKVSLEHAEQHGDHLLLGRGGRSHHTCVKSRHVYGAHAGFNSPACTQKEPETSDNISNRWQKI